MGYTKKQKEYDSFVERYNEEQEKYERSVEAKRRLDRYNNILITVIGIISLVLISGLSIYFWNIDFDYNLKKCSTLDSFQSSYDFTNTMEIDAKYNAECYYLENHPYARFYRVYLPVVGFSLFSVVFLLLFMYIIKTIITPVENHSGW